MPWENMTEIAPQSFYMHVAFDFVDTVCTVVSVALWDIVKLEGNGRSGAQNYVEADMSFMFCPICQAGG